MGIHTMKTIYLLPFFFTSSLSTLFSFATFNPFNSFFDSGNISRVSNGGGHHRNTFGDRDLDTESLMGAWELHSNDAGISAMHLVLLPQTNKAVMFDSAVLGPSNVMQPKGRCRFVAKTKVWDCWAHGIVYDTDTAKTRTLTVQTDTWCSSGGLMADGTLLQTGGFDDGGRAMRLLTNCDTCDWREYTIALTGQRWYGSQQTLADGSFVVVGGRRMFNYEFIPKEGTVNTKNINLPFLRQTTDMFENNLYPFVLLAPDSNLFVFANNRSIILNPTTGAVLREFPVISDGSRNYPASGLGAFLPIRLQPGMEPASVRVEVLVCGGAKNNADEIAEKTKKFLPALKSCGRMEITSRNPKWKMEMMPSPRVMGDMLVLPTGDLIMLNGAKDGVAGWGLADLPNFTPVLYRPFKSKELRFKELNPTTIPRMYHSSSAVLPDGKVMVAGSNTNSRYTFKDVKFPTELRVEKFSPPYLDPSLQKHRPEIDEVSAKRKITYKQRFTVPFRQTGDSFMGKDDVRVTFYSPPFTTHGFSQNQRMLVLGKTDFIQLGKGYYSVEVEAPPSSAIAPAGFYMLSVVYRGIPSKTMWVQII